MGIFKFIAKKLKGGKRAKGTAQSVSGGCERDSRILHSIPAIREQAISDVRGISVLARACAVERGRDTGTVQEDPIRRESRALIAAAKSVGCYLEFKIDQLVYKLYGLTEDEIAIVESQGAGPTIPATVV